MLPLGRSGRTKAVVRKGGLCGGARGWIAPKFLLGGPNADPQRRHLNDRSRGWTSAVFDSRSQSRPSIYRRSGQHFMQQVLIGLWVQKMGVVPTCGKTDMSRAQVARTQPGTNSRRYERIVHAIKHRDDSHRQSQWRADLGSADPQKSSMQILWRLSINQHQALQLLQGRSRQVTNACHPSGMQSFRTHSLEIRRHKKRVI